MAVVLGGDDDDYEQDYFDQIINQRSTANGNENIGEQEVVLTKEERLKPMVESELEVYMSYCERARWTDLIASYPTENYRTETTNSRKIEVSKNPMYTALLFDLMGWWKRMGKERWPHITVAAFIVLPKPFHSGFQHDKQKPSTRGPSDSSESCGTSF
jgi:hypothetical protein